MRLICAGALLVPWLCVPLRAHDPITSTVTWNGDISRLVHARCVGCHVAGGRGPMPLTRYEDARPWARAIREEVLARRMPKWHAARGYGEFVNDRSLTPFEIALFVAWVDGGAPRGKEKEEEEKEEGRRRKEEAAPAPPYDARIVTLACGERPLPPGRLLAVKPELRERGAAGITILFPDGQREVIAWIRGFEKKFAETYWLRTPIDMPDGARLQVDARGRCRVGVTMK